jgi:peptidoglycan/LPS O-acetylase OafA/YrhL
VLILTARHTNSVLQAVLLVPILAAIALQGPLFQPLRWKPIRFVGEISYSVYILHYPIIWIIFTLFISPAMVEQMGFVDRTLVLAGGGCVALVVAALCFVFVERPFVAYSKRWSRKAEEGRVVAASPALTLPA